MWSMINVGSSVSICFPRVTTVRRYRGANLDAELTPRQENGDLYCIDDTLQELGLYGYVGVNSDTGESWAATLHVYHPANPPTLIDTGVYVVHPAGVPPTAARVIGPSASQVEFESISDTLTLARFRLDTYGGYVVVFDFNGVKRYTQLFFRRVAAPAEREVGRLRRLVILSFVMSRRLPLPA